MRALANLLQLVIVYDYAQALTDDYSLAVVLSKKFLADVTNEFRHINDRLDVLTKGQQGLGGIPCTGTDYSKPGI